MDKSEAQNMVEMITHGQPRAPYSLEECEHDNYDTTYEDAELWQGICLDCGAELEDDLINPEE